MTLDLTALGWDAGWAAHLDRRAGHRPGRGVDGARPCSDEVDLAVPGVPQEAGRRAPGLVGPDGRWRADAPKAISPRARQGPAR